MDAVRESFEVDLKSCGAETPVGFAMGKEGRESKLRPDNFFMEAGKFCRRKTGRNKRMAYRRGEEGLM